MKSTALEGSTAGGKLRTATLQALLIIPLEILRELEEIGQMAHTKGFLGLVVQS